MGHSTDHAHGTSGQEERSPPREQQPSAAGHPKTGAIDNAPKGRTAQQPQAAGGGHGPGTSKAVPTPMRVLPAVLALFGLPLSFFGFKVVEAGRAASTYDPTGGSSAIALVGVLMMAMGGGYLLAAYGTWTLKPWGWTLAVGVLGAGALSSLLVLTGSASGVGLVGLLANGGLCWYLSANRSLYRRLAGAG
jgi:hypothetical protein